MEAQPPLPHFHSPVPVEMGAFLRLIAAVLAAALVAEAAAVETHHVVGGWGPDLDVGAWLSGRIFRVGDKLWFGHSSGDEIVVEVNSAEEFEKCDTANPIRMYTDDHVSLEKEGLRFFTSADADRCRNGLKLPVTVSRRDEFEPPYEPSDVPPPHHPFDPPEPFHPPPQSPPPYEPSDVPPPHHPFDPPEPFHPPPQSPPPEPVHPTHKSPPPPPPHEPPKPVHPPPPPYEPPKPVHPPPPPPPYEPPKPVHPPPPPPPPPQPSSANMNLPFLVILTFYLCFVFAV
ncbi:protein TRACHEARY ELEMENT DIFFERENTIATION-RELATED 7A-like [Andrographis paniculata]|uniref:protein TRACHEARY ELEMENT DIFFERENTIATION-RELATED 7A-like n=1 Tax=Andrographis paniculata TaxID=175694 RepID=UPI0021E8CEB8|nr:protein TRACHEARY ELEMENT DIFFERENTIATION-RELATED 7A-like [Andrographis paniculata]